MNRRVFESVFVSLRSALMERAAAVLEEQGLVFDKAAYEAQKSFETDDICREIIMFGANCFPNEHESLPEELIQAA